MSLTKQLDLGQFNVASVDQFEAIITKDGAVWNLSGATVTFDFQAPDRISVISRAASPVTDGTDGKFFYNSTVTDFLTPGWWTMGVRVQLGGVDKRYPYEISFLMVSEP